MCVISILQPIQGYSNCPRHKTSSLTFLPSEPHSLINISLDNILVIFPLRELLWKSGKHTSTASTTINVEDNCSQCDVHYGYPNDTAEIGFAAPVTYQVCYSFRILNNTGRWTTPQNTAFYLFPFILPGAFGARFYILTPFWYHFSDAISTPPHLPVPAYLSLGVVILSGNSKGIQQQIPPGRGAEHRRWSAACGGAGRCDADSAQLAGSRLLSAEGR